MDFVGDVRGDADRLGDADDSAVSSVLQRLIDAVDDPTRRRILLAFYEDPRVRTVDDVALFAGIHRTVAFNHLEHLVRLGYLTKSKRRGRIGKPAGLYDLAGARLDVSYPPRHFGLLAGLLATCLWDLGVAGLRRARSAGVELGANLAVRGAPTVAEALQPLEALGGSYAVEGDRVIVRNCLFQEACRASPAVVCGLHGGVIEGLLNSSGFSTQVTPCPSPDASACVYVLSEVSPEARSGA
jgi:predicted ArsR family transcriptional regulator